MINRTKSVQETLEEYGYRQANLDTIPESHRRVMERCQSAFEGRVSGHSKKYGVELNIEFVWIDDISFNAHAWSEFGDVIGINTGCVSHLFDDLFFVFDESYMVQWANRQAFIPRTRAKKWYSKENQSFRIDLIHSLIYSSLTFIYYHEFCHIWHGHTDWLKFRNEDPSISEEISSGLNVKELNVGQVFEMDADCFAAKRLFTDMKQYDFVLEYHDIINSMFVFDGLEEQDSIIDARARLVVFSISLVFLIIYDRKREYLDKSSSHPPEGFRVGWITQMMGHLAADESDKSHEFQFNNRVGDTSAQTAMIATDIFRCRYDLSFLSSAEYLVSHYKDPQARDHHHSIFIKWSYIREELEWCKRGGVLQPDQADTFRADLLRDPPGADINRILNLYVEE